MSKSPERKPTGRGRNWRAKYALKDDITLLRGEFENFRVNEFAHLKRQVEKIDNRLWYILIGVVLALIAGIFQLVSRL